MCLIPNTIISVASQTGFELKICLDKVHPSHSSFQLAAIICIIRIFPIRFLLPLLLICILVCLGLSLTPILLQLIHITFFMLYLFYLHFLFFSPCSSAAGFSLPTYSPSIVIVGYQRERES